MAQILDDVDIVVGSGSADENDEQKEASLNRALSISESVRSDEEQVMEENMMTSCTTCSICIDEFEAGERIRFLPRCKHAFHTPCIMPWLTERQGCCPLCKTSVIEPGEGGEMGHDTTTDVDATISHDENGTEHGSLSTPISPEERGHSTPPADSDAVVVPLSRSSDDPVVRSEVESRRN